MRILKPLIKWTGGKSSEIKHIVDIIPEYERYIEPFFGGGALFFYLKPKKAIINDISNNLMDFYKLVKKGSEVFKKELFQYVIHWNRIVDFIEPLFPEIINIYDKFSINNLSEYQLEEEINRIFDENSSIFFSMFEEDFCIEQFCLFESIRKSLLTRIFKIKKKIDKNNNFNSSDIREHIETGVKSGFYYHFRDILNQKLDSKNEITKEKKIANYYFIREYCFGGMFRHNDSGEFNIPYGGINYNKKDFSKKIKYVISEDVKNLFRNTIIKNMDFEKAIIESKLTNNDFMFIDPPYDSVFSKYGDNNFSKKDHQRLANILSKTKSNFIIIIKETPFISELYSDKRKFEMTSFSKTYTSNIKSRYNRDVKHLIVTKK